MKILFLGALHSDHAIRTRRASNPAAAQWTRGLLNGLKEQGAEITGVTYCSEQLWPRGELLPGCETDFDSAVEHIWCRYPNVYCLREWYLGLRYPQLVVDLLRRRSFDAVLAYNVLFPSSVNALLAANRLKVPCFPIILDGDDPRRDDWRWLRSGTRMADGIVFLSDWMIKNYPGEKPTFQLDGACVKWRGDDAKTEPNLIVYAGALDRWRGLDFLADSIRRVRNPDCRFVVCGKCDIKSVREIIGGDARVEIKGFVSDSELHELSLRAGVFLNTRDPKNGDNAVNFPSKIPNCLAYGKPIVSTWTPSLSEGYRRYLILPESDTPDCFAAKIDSVLAWDQPVRTAWKEAQRAWVCENKLWSVQARRLLEWMSGCVGQPTVRS